MTDINKVHDNSGVEKNTDDSISSEEIMLEATVIQEETDNHKEDVEISKGIKTKENNEQLILLTKQINNLDGANEKPKKRIIDILREEEKDKTRGNIVFTAVENLEDPEQIREFFKQYIEELINVEEKNREYVAKYNIKYVISYYSDNKLLAKRSDALGGLPNHLKSIAGRKIKY